MFFTTNSFLKAHIPFSRKRRLMFTLLAMLLCVSLAVFPTAGLSESAPASDDISSPDKSVIAKLSLSGEHSPGISFIVHDVYFDGWQLMLSITQAPNGTGYSVYNTVLGDTDVNADVIAEGTLPLGSYCETYLFDTSGTPLDSLMVGYGSSANNSFTIDECYRFLPYEQQEKICVSIACGVMETPGVVLDEIQTLDFTIPIQKKADVRTIKLTDNEGQPPYLDEITIAETADVAGIFAFYTHNVSGDCICPIAFVFPDDTTLDAAEYANNEGDKLNHRGYTYCAVRKTQPLSMLRVRDLHSGKDYIINLADGTVEKAE